MLFNGKILKTKLVTFGMLDNLRKQTNLQSLCLVISMNVLLVIILCILTNSEDYETVHGLKLNIITSNSGIYLFSRDKSAYFCTVRGTAENMFSDKLLK